MSVYNDEFTYDTLDDVTNKLNPYDVNSDTQPQNDTNTTTTTTTDTSNIYGSQQDIGSTNSRLQDIENREQACIVLQQELDQREEKLRKIQKRRRPPKNWPTPQLGWARNAIQLDIPHEYQKEVREFYFFWCIGCFGTCWNYLVLLWYGLSPASKGDGDFGAIQYFIGLTYIFVGMPAAWMFWYKRYYRAMMRHGDIPQLFFVFLFLHLGYLGIMALGFSATSSMGFLTMIRCIANKKDTSIIIALSINCLIFILAGLGGLWLLRVAYRAFGRWHAKKYLEEERLKMQQGLN